MLILNYLLISQKIFPACFPHAQVFSSWMPVLGGWVASEIRLCPLELLPSSPSPEWWAGLVALVYRLWGLRGW